MELELFGWIVVVLSATMVGITKTGIPGMGILVVPLMAGATATTTNPMSNASNPISLMYFIPYLFKNSYNSSYLNER